MIEQIAYLESRDKLKTIASSFALVTDHNLEHKYANKLAQVLGDTLLIAIPPGEEGKTREIKATIEDEMLAGNLGRDCAVIALGGGVVTDVAGFVAATYCRGVPLISIPTTFLAMVDAAIGGKTGVNTPKGKNLIGAFYKPSLLIYDLDLLKSLSSHEMLLGLAEVIKYGIICDETLFQKIDAGKPLWDNKDPKYIEELVFLSVQHKLDIVSQDHREAGMRRILNFGHTIGHAIEKVLDFTIAHGLAVALGMLAEAKLSLLMGHLDEISFARIQSVLKQYNYPLSIDVNQKSVKEAMILDKKSTGGTPRFTLLSGVGKPLPSEGNYCTTVPESMLDSVLEELCHGTL